VNTTSRESSSKTDERIDNLVNQISTLVEIVSKKVVTPATVKAVEESCVTCSGPHAYYNCPSTDRNQSSVCAATGTYNQVAPPNHASNYMAPPGFATMQNNGQNRYNQNQGQGNNFNRGNNFQGNQGFQVPNNHAPNLQNQGFQNQPFQVPNNQVQQRIPNEFSSYMKASESIKKNMQSQINELRGKFSKQEESLRRNLNNDMRSILGSFFQNQASTSGTLPSNTIPNPKGEMKAITTRSGVAYEGPSIPTNPSPKKVVERETEETTDKEQTNFQGSTAHIQPLVIPIPILEPDVPRTLPKPNIPYPSRINQEKLREKSNAQMMKFLEIFQKIHFDMSFADIPLNENCSAMLLKKLPEKLGDPGKFLIPCDFPGMDVCHALADLGASINLMPLSIWKKLSLPELTPTRMTLELADRSITRPKGVAEDVFVKVGKFHFPTDFVVVDFDADPRVPLILGRSFLRTGRALIDVYGEEITLRVNDEAVTFNLNQTTRYSSTYDDMSVNRIDVIDVACEEYAQEVLGFSNNSTGGNPTPTSEPIISDSSLSLTPFEGSDFILEEIEAYLKDDSISPKINHADFDLEGDLRLIEELLNNDPSSPLPLSHNPLSSSTTFSSPSLTPVETSDALLEKFVDELALLEPFLSGISDDDFDLEGDILLLGNLLNVDPSSPLPPKELNFEKLKMIKYSIDDFSSINVYEEKFVTFSNPLFEYDDEYISSDINPLFDEVLEDIESKDSYVSNLDESALLVTPLSDANEDECFDPGGAIDEINAFLDMDISTDNENGYHDSDGDIIYLESFLIDDTVPNLPPEVFLDHDPRSLKDEPDNDDLMTEDKLSDGFFSSSLLREPMTHLLEKDAPFVFSQDCIDAFETLKKKLTEAPILVVPDWNLPFELMCDASDFAIGAVLGQRKTKHFQPIHYASKTMTEAQIHYTTVEKEMLAVVYAFEKFRPYLVLSKSIVYTDHSALKYLLSKQDAKPRLLRWVLLL
ncbi:reverse transcriptase domain-containing protein, partial [Tanacetum coccineum]